MYPVVSMGGMPVSIVNGHPRPAMGDFHPAMVMGVGSRAPQQDRQHHHRRAIDPQRELRIGVCKETEDAVLNGRYINGVQSVPIRVDPNAVVKPYFGSTTPTTSTARAVYCSPSTATTAAASCLDPSQPAMNPVRDNLLKHYSEITSTDGNVVSSVQLGKYLTYVGKVTTKTARRRLACDACLAGWLKPRGAKTYTLVVNEAVLRGEASIDGSHGLVDAASSSTTTTAGDPSAMPTASGVDPSQPATNPVRDYLLNHYSEITSDNESVVSSADLGKYLKSKGKVTQDRKRLVNSAVSAGWLKPRGAKTYTLVVNEAVLRGEASIDGSHGLVNTANYKRSLLQAEADLKQSLRELESSSEVLKERLQHLGAYSVRAALSHDKGPQAFELALRARRSMESIARAKLGANVSVFAFGSVVALGVWNTTDDVDFTVVDPDSWKNDTWLDNKETSSPLRLNGGEKKQRRKKKKQQEQERVIISDLDSELRKLKIDDDGRGLGTLTHLARARVPIVKHIKREPLALSDPELLQQQQQQRLLSCIDFDVSCRAHGVRNSYFLRQYLLQREEFRIVSILLKQWGKTSTTVHNPMKGYLTSYAINMLLIHFLLQKGHCSYVDPSSIPQLPSNEQTEWSYVPLVPGELLASQDRLTTLEQRVGELVHDFFRFYALEFDWQTTPIDIRTDPRVTKTPLRKSAAASGGSHLSIVDPYEQGFDLARRYTHDKDLELSAELLMAYQSITTVCSESSFEETFGKPKPTLQKRLQKKSEDEVKDDDA